MKLLHLIFCLIGLHDWADWNTGGPRDEMLRYAQGRKCRHCPKVEAL